MEIEVAGVGFTVQGLTVVPVKDWLPVEMPAWKRDGVPLPVFVLPKELQEPAGQAVQKAYMGNLRPR